MLVFSNVCNHLRFKSFSFQLLLRFVRSDFRLYFVFVLRNISVFVSVNEIISISVSVSVNEYITAVLCCRADSWQWRCRSNIGLEAQWRLLHSVMYSVVAGFKSFDSYDQATIIRLGQSASRVVLAAVHWYDVDLKLFRNFLAWRSSSLVTSSPTDLFKQQLIDYAESISSLDVDPIEAALLNSLLIIATGLF